MALRFDLPERDARQMMLLHFLICDNSHVAQCTSFSSSPSRCGYKVVPAVHATSELSFEAISPSHDKLLADRMLVSLASLPPAALAIEVDNSPLGTQLFICAISRPQLLEHSHAMRSYVAYPGKICLIGIGSSCEVRTDFIAKLLCSTSASHMARLLEAHCL